MQYGDACASFGEPDKMPGEQGMHRARSLSPPKDGIDGDIRQHVRAKSENHTERQLPKSENAADDTKTSMKMDQS
jgi:hypothetical protein